MDEEGVAPMSDDSFTKAVSKEKCEKLFPLLDKLDQQAKSADGLLELLLELEEINSWKEAACVFRAWMNYNDTKNTLRNITGIK